MHAAAALARQGIKIIINPIKYEKKHLLLTRSYLAVLCRL